MNSMLMDLLYSTLIEVVPRTIAIFIPLVGAFWIFKAREKSGSEGKIFEIGREIANVLQSKNIRGPLEGISGYYIDRAKYKLNEPNHEKSLNAILKENLFNPKHLIAEPSAEDKVEAAETLIALTAERWGSLVPPTVSWSGRGVAYSPFGEKIAVDDTYFPFGTKLYREWIGRFTGIDRDLWTITNNRHFFLDSYFDEKKTSGHWGTRVSVNEWLDEIDGQLKEIRKLHDKLLTQIQTIDAKIDLPRLGRDISILCFYVALLSISGYFAPRLLHLSDLLSSANLIWLAVATTMSYLVLGIRVASAVQPVKDENAQRKIFLPALVQELKYMEKNFVRYRPHVINNIVSMRFEMKLPSRLAVSLEKLSQKIHVFNESASALYDLTYERIRELGLLFPTADVNMGGFSINVADLICNNFDFVKVKARILNENGNIEFSAQEVRSSRVILKVYLSDLTEGQRLDFCDCLERIRRDIQGATPYAPVMKLFQELQSLRKTSAAMLSQIA